MQCLLCTCTMIDKMLTRWRWMWEKVGKPWEKPWEKKGPTNVLKWGLWIGRYRAYGWSPRHVWHIHIHDHYQGSVSCTHNIWLFTPYHALIRDHLLHTMHKYMINFYSIPCMYKYMIIYSIPCTICMIMYSFLWQKRVRKE